MSEESAFNTKRFLQSLIGKRVFVRLKWGNEYVGTAVSSDSYMNLHLENCDEYIKGQSPSSLGEVLIRCNNILYIQEHCEN